jgi:tRNA(Ile2) C34 agmatinyltransferase TiaS
MHDNYILCPGCGDDMNTADWEAHGMRCTECGSAFHPVWQEQALRRNPLKALHNRLTATRMLEARHVFA